MFDFISKKSYKSGILLGLLLLFCVCMFLISEFGGKEDVVAKISVKCIEVIQRNTPVTQEFVGSVVTAEEIQIKAKVTGFITERKIAANYPVTKGQPLFQIDRRNYEAEFLNRQADLAAVKSALSETEIAVDRYQMLFKAGAVSKQQLNQIVIRNEMNIAAVNANSALVQQAQNALNDTLIVSPVDGRVGAKYLNTGDFVTAGQTVLATISSTDPIRIKFSLSENEYLQLLKDYEKNSLSKNTENKSLHIILGDGSKYPVEGKIIEVDQVLSDISGTVGITAEFPNTSNVLLPGMFVRVALVGEERRGALLVPQRAIIENSGQHFVMVINAEGRIESRTVKIGPKYGSFQIIDEGINLKDIIVVEDLDKVKQDSEALIIMMTPEEISALSKK